MGFNISNSALFRYISCNKYCLYIVVLLVIKFLFVELNAQTKFSGAEFFAGHRPNQNSSVFVENSGFIENIGQFGDTFSGYGHLGKILYSFDGMDMPVLLTKRGLIFLQRSVSLISEEERERLEKLGIKAEVIAEKNTVKESVIAVQWISASNNLSVIQQKPNDAYHTYACVQGKAFAYKQIVYKNIYQGIDLILSVDSSAHDRFKYSFILEPFADIHQIQMQIGGDVSAFRKDWNGRLHIASPINDILQTEPVSYYLSSSKLDNTQESVKAVFVLNDQTLSFDWKRIPDQSRAIMIDPFVSSGSNLTGANSGKAKDVDFDYAGNVYVTGGGDGSIYKLAKYNASGTLQWTFNGSLTVPAWTFGTYYGGWVVDKTSGHVYLGQGFAPGGGFRVIRLNTAGNYDNYITTANSTFMENWKMLWSCNSGSPQIIIAGGGTNSNINLGVFAPPSTTISGVNITGIPYSGSSGWAQDISDIVIDPVNNQLYSIYGSLIGTPSLSNKIYKNAAPYSSTSMLWNVASGYTVIQEIANRPYLVAGQIDNSSNVLAVNSSYMFYYDGLNLKAFNKATGAAVGTAITISGNSALMQGGIVADECNNIFLGSVNGTIKVYTFNGTTFNDSTPDISISGYSSSSVYDLVLSDARKIIYASGNGFVAAINVAGYGCASNVYTLSVSTSCSNQTATVTLSPAPPQNSSVTYNVYNGSALIASNQTGQFSGLIPNITYSMQAIINQSCSGVEAVKSFVIAGPAISISKTNATCGNANGAISISATGGTGSLQYSKDGISFQNGSSFTGLTAGFYTVVVKDSLGCSSTVSVLITNSNGPQTTAVITNAFCGSATGRVVLSGSGGTAPYTYKLGNGSYTGNSTFANLAAGTYLFYIKDTNACVNVQSYTIISSGSSSSIIVKQVDACGKSSGSFSISTTGGTAPYQYALNSGAYQTGHVFSGLSSGAYTILVKDSLNCISTLRDTIQASAGPQLSTTVVSTSCSGASGRITMTLSGGTSPFEYSINGGSTYQSSNVFNNLSAGTYNLAVRDANSCISSSLAIVTKSYPQITDSTTKAGCNTFTGSITAIGTGGTSPYQYSINGVNYKSGNVFSNLQSGTYTLYIRDTAGCINSVTPVVVANASGLSISGTAQISSCAANTGSITLTASGGTTPYTFSIDSVNYQNSGAFTGLAPGNYTARVKDANGCISRMLIRVGMLQGPTASISVTTATCNNANGKVTVTASLGKSPYLYSRNGTTFQSSNVLKGISAGTYTITVKDSNLCITTLSATVGNVGSTTGPTVTATTLDAECGLSTGKINGNGSGGKNPKRYSINGINYQGSTNFSDVPPGNYTLYVMDDNGCTNEVSVTVGNVTGPLVSVSDTATTCGNSVGAIVCTGYNGVAPYKYSIDNGVNFQNSNTFTGLSAGFYTVVVRDNANVCKNSIVVKISNSNGPAISLTKKDATCGANSGRITGSATGGTGAKTWSLDGINYQSSSVFNGLSAGDYAVYAKDSLGCVNSTTITVGSVAAPQIRLTQVSETCGQSNGRITAIGSSGTAPYQYQLDTFSYKGSSVFTGLKAGTYKVTLKDTNLCMVSANITISMIAGPKISSRQFPVTCNANNGAILSTGRDGTMQYQYSINGSSFGQSFLFDHLSAGQKIIAIKDSNNCLAYDTVTLSSRSLPVVTLVEDTTLCAPGRGSIVVTVTGGTSPYQYSLDSVTYQNSNKFNCVLSGTYQVYIKDSNVCQDNDVIQIQGVALRASLLEFNVSIDGGAVLCSWTSSEEENLQYYQVDRSVDGYVWEPVGIVKGKGNFKGISQYEILDLSPHLGLSYYRLTEHEVSGKGTHLGVRQVYVGNSSQVKIEPNPASDYFIIETSEFRPQISIQNTEGKFVEFTSIDLGNTIKVSTKTWPEDIYIITIVQHQQVQQLKLVVVH